LELAMPSLKERAKTLVELIQSADFLFKDGPPVLDAAAENLLSIGSRDLVRRSLAALEATDWTAARLEEAARAFAQSEGLKLGLLAQPLRAAVTGRASSPPLFAMMALLGREESLTRIRAYMA
jgi:glutamyl-tRNA synthetase